MTRVPVSLIGAALIGLWPAFPDGPTPDPLLNWMNQIAQRQLDARDREMAAIHTVEDAKRRKIVVRRKILDSLGGLPKYDGPLNARVTGQIQADGYVIEKVIYESLPRFYVTANLYRPNGPGRYPAVLFQAGHTQEGKAEPQWLQANLALKGFVSLVFDPIGQGEREQSYDPQLKAPLGGWSTPEHVQAGAQATLVGESLTRYFIWDAKRSIDYLVSRPDVDPAQIGAAGCSGGGALTTFIGALDPRLKVVIPACFPNSFRILFTGDDPHSEMTIPRHLSAGLDTADFVELSAPTPWLIQATEQDYFVPPSAKMMYEDARRFYDLYGAGDKIDFFVGPGPHGTPLVSREAVYKWLIRWLKDGSGDYHDHPVKMYNNFELLVTKTGHVDDEPGSRKFYQVLLDSLEAKRKPGTKEELLDELRSLGVPTSETAPATKMLDEVSETGFRVEHVQFESEPGIEIDARLYVPSTQGRKPAVVLLNGKLADSLAPKIAAMGSIVLKMEPRHSIASDVRRPFIGDWMAANRAEQIGISLPGRKAHDILRGVDLLCARPDVDCGSIRAMAQDVKGIWLLLAAAVDTRVGKIWLDRTPYTFMEALHNTINTNLYDAAIPGFALHWDLQDVVSAIGPRKVLWTDPANWMQKVTPAGPGFRYRWVLGDLTDMSDVQDDEFLRELMSKQL
jgi:cephalosporin-C deacetylase-like acetyl esterase